jgi:1-acyl-sn-glycerol-3-phosphate acyltransferase
MLLMAVPPALVAWAVGLLLLHLMRTRYTWAQSPFYVLHVFYTRFVWRARISRPLPVKPGEGAVVVCNHASSIDPSFIQMGTDKVVHWMVASEYSLSPRMAWMFRIVESIPVSRGGIDTAATKMAIRYAKNGEVVGMFPEGRINTTDALLLPGRPGAALVALKARVPVIPCYVSGAPYDGTEFGCFRMRAQVYLKVGDPLDLSEFYGRESDKEVLIEVTRRFMSAIARLSGSTDYVPEVAGRRWSPQMTDS